MSEMTEADHGPHIAPRSAFTCECGRVYLDSFEFGAHYWRCTVITTSLESQS